MSSRHQLNALLEHPQIWRATHYQPSEHTVVATGFGVLDRALAGGWPTSDLSELLVAQWGMGEFGLLVPALRSLCSDLSVTGWINLINPPYIPYAPGLAAAQIDISRLLVVSGADNSDACWAMEQALHSRSCAAVVAWCDTLSGQSLRRLQLAAQAGCCLAVLFRHERYRHQRSPAALRTWLHKRNTSGLQIEILKHRGNRPSRLVLENL